MRRTSIALVMTAVTAATATQRLIAQTPDVMFPVHQFVDGFNKGDTRSMLAACAAQTSIIDEFPPHEWSGAGACGRWIADFDQYSKKNGITETVVTLGKPLHVEVTGDRAYVVIPSDYAFKANGKPDKESGSLFTFVLQRGATSWRIIGWSWAKH